VPAGIGVDQSDCCRLPAQHMCKNALPHALLRLVVAASITETVASLLAT
jgi:hypothetical protein